MKKFIINIGMIILVIGVTISIYDLFTLVVFKESLNFASQIVATFGLIWLFSTGVMDLLAIKKNIKLSKVADNYMDAYKE